MIDDLLQRRPYNAAVDLIDRNVARGLGDKIAFMGEIDNKQVDFEGWTQADCEKAAVHAMETCGMKHFIPCITQGGPGSLYQGTYKGLWDAIDDYNCKHFGFTKEQLEAQRLPMSIMF